MEFIFRSPGCFIALLGGAQAYQFTSSVILALTSKPHAKYNIIVHQTYIRSCALTYACNDAMAAMNVETLVCV